MGKYFSLLKKMGSISTAIACVLGGDFYAAPLRAQTYQGNSVGQVENEKPISRVLIIYDASNSMNARWQSDTKMAISRRLLMQILDSLDGTPQLQLALRVYGHQSPYPPLDCQDTRLEVPFENNNVKKVIHRVRTLVPRGGTPIAYSLEQAAYDFPPCDHCRNLIILITDGIEECGGDPCKASAFLQSKGIALKPFIIGIGDNFENSFHCVGEYFDASKEEDFIRAFEVVISQALNTTTAQVNLLDEKGEPSETNVNMSFYDHISKQLVYSYVHTLNYRGLPDTITLDPLRTYDMVVHTLPSKKVDSIRVKTGTHNVIGLDVAQGDLMIKMSGSRSTVAKTIACVLRKSGTEETLHVQYVNDKERFLAGKYDLEILSLPRVYVKEVEVKPRHTTTVDLPMPGILVFKRNGDGYATLYQIKPQGEEGLIHSFAEVARIETLYLQPGQYRVVNRPKYNLRTSATRDKIFNVEAGATVNVNL